jgi:sulfate adenylyltransferase large subunit
MVLDNVKKDIYETIDLLRFSTAGSVDDGKSTLIGRLLYETKNVFEDQLDAVKKTTERSGRSGIDFSLLTDGLSAEREQGITIDVAYRYFSTLKRKFIVTDTPGHEQYTRNMVTGCSQVNLTIILLDARMGVLPQSRRHGFITKLLGIQHVLIAVNKMDLVDYSQSVFESIKNDYQDFSKKIGIPDVKFIPISALQGDNVVQKSSTMPWYLGPTILEYLETVPIGLDININDFRFPVQVVLRPNLNYRGFAGRIASGRVKKGDAILSLPSKAKSTIKSIDAFQGEIVGSCPSQSVTLLLADEIDISRGDMIVHPSNLPMVSSNFNANLCWMVTSPLKVGQRYLLKHTTQIVKATILAIDYRVNIYTLEHEKALILQLNDIAKVNIETFKPIFFDPYQKNKVTGSFILIDEVTNATVAAGMIL